jgi:hypothetical protein
VSFASAGGARVFSEGELSGGDLTRAGIYPLLLKHYILVLLFEVLTKDTIDI